MNESIILHYGHGCWEIPCHDSEELADAIKEGMSPWIFPCGEEKGFIDLRLAIRRFG